MSNKVIFNLDDLFISVGIDVGADFSWMSIALPNQQFVGKPYKILHNSIDSLTTAVSKIKEAEELRDASDQYKSMRNVLSVLSFPLPAFLSSLQQDFGQSPVLLRSV